ncbi:hypothetical protein VNO80_01209 [Phaseolus coccineus]|uniref:NB-ARC domain-containing protein n=1 Tax=Phaseolus coccineus TaxID=3886 RepID=A0AAN9P5Y5_PHACN
MECLLGFASSISRDLVCGALNQLRYPCCFNNFVKKLEEEEGDLIVTRDSVKKFVTNAKKQTRKTSEVVDKWLQDAINDVDNVNQLLKEAKAKRIYCFGHCPNWIWQYRVGKKLANKNMYLEKFIAEGRKYVPFDRIATLPSGTLDILSEKCMNFESRQSAYEKLLEAVKNNDVAMIGLYGMGGCGKTTLAMEVMKLAEAKHYFEKVLFVPISSTVEVRRIQEKIASSLQYTFPETEVMERAQRLCLRLNQEKNILVILDDVWEKLDFGGIGIPSSEHHKGCKILITTRSEEVCTLMDCQRKIYLPILTDEEAWTLFQNKALISEDTLDTLKNLGRLISNECKGLPVAIAAVASSLKGKAETIWSVALNKLRSSKPINIERGLIDPYKCLQLSYDNLDTKEAKSLFLLCSVFPEDYEIPLETLTRYAIGLGVVGEAHSYEEARSEVVAAKIKLVSSCLLLDEEDEFVKMHDIVRDVAHLIAKNENKIIKCEEEKDVTIEQNSVRYLWCVKFPNDLDCSNLEFLYLKTKLEELNGIFKRMRMLKVLILFNDKDGITPLSTMSLKTLTNLRYLDISYYELSDFSFVSDMKKLQSLLLKGCLLPSFDVAITQVTTLKLLHLYKCEMKVKNFEVIKKIPLLEELYIVDIEGKWTANSEDNIEFFNTFSVPQTLQRYAIVLGSHNFYDYSYFKSHPRTLLLNHFHKSNDVIKGLAKKATGLFVANIQGGAKNIIPDIFKIEGGGLDELSKFEIRNSEEIECLIDTSNHSNQIIGDIVQVVDQNKIEELDEIIEEGKHPHLYNTSIPSTTIVNNSPGELSLAIGRRVEFLTINCSANGLKARHEDYIAIKISNSDFVPPVENVQYLSKQPQALTFLIMHNIREIELKGFDKVKYLFKPSIASLLLLEILTIKQCHELEHIIDTEDEYGKENLNAIFPNLRELSVHDCGQFKYMLGQYPVANQDCEEIHIHLSTLEILSLHNLPNFVSICATKTLTVTWPSLKYFYSVSCLAVPSDSREHFSISSKDPKGIQNHFLTLQYVSIRNSEVKGIFFLNGQGIIEQQVNLRLEDLLLENLPQMTNIWVASKNSVNLQHLTTLEITGCEKLEVIFPKHVLRCLQELNHLKIRKCKELRQIIEDDVEGKKLSNLLSPQPCFPKLQALYVGHCHKMKRFISRSASNDFPNLHLLIINGASELEELVGCGQGKSDEIRKSNVELPRLKLLTFMHLSNFRQEIELPNVKNCVVYECPKLSLTPTTTLGELKENFPYKDFRNTRVYKWEIEEIMSYLGEDAASSEFTSLHEIGEVGNESIEEGSAAEGDKTKPLSIGVEDISIGGGVATHIEFGGIEILAQDSKVVEQDDKMNEGKAGIMPSQEIQVEEGLNLLDKQEEIHIVSNNNINISPDEMCQHVLTRDLKLREDIAERKMDENSKRSSSVDMVLDSQAIEQGDRPNENCRRTSPFVKTQNVNSNFEEGSNLVDKEGEIGIVSNDRIMAARNEEPEKEFVAKVFTSKIPNSQPVERPISRYLNIPLCETPSNAFVNKKQFSEPCFMNQQNPLGEIVSSPKIPQSIEREVVQKTIQKNISMGASSIHSESTRSQLDQIFTFQTKSYPHSGIRSSQTETHTAKENEGHPKIIQDFGANDIMNLFAPVVVGKEGEDNIVGKTFVKLEKYLKMSLKDIVSSETNSISLLSALNFLSNLPFKDVTLSDGLKDIVGTMQQEFPSIVCSFKKGFATTEKLAELEACGNEVTITLGSKISEAKNFYDEAQLKEVVLKEQIIRLKEEIIVCEDALSSLEEEKNKWIAETIRYKMELENVRKDRSQMVEDQRKVQQELFEVTYKWSVLCSQYEYNRMAARNPS